MKAAFIAIALMIVAIFAVGCQERGTRQGADAGTKAGTQQMANPASVYCEDHGGKLEIVNEEAGQRGICTLSDGTKCDEWAYYRGECPGSSGSQI